MHYDSKILLNGCPPPPASETIPVIPFYFVAEILPYKRGVSLSGNSHPVHSSGITYLRNCLSGPLFDWYITSSRHYFNFIHSVNKCTDIHIFSK